MAIVKAVSSKASIKTAIEYVTKEEKTEDKLVSGIRCSADNAYEEMQTTKVMWGKTDGRTYKHFVQSYHPEDGITPEQAHANAIELAEKTKAFDGFEVLVATHIDRDHIHSHIIVNSVNAEDGHKLQWTKKDLNRMKELSNKQSQEQGLHVAEKGKSFDGSVREDTTAYTKEAYQKLKKAESGEAQSYIQEIAIKVLQARETAKSREDFIKSLDGMGISTDWKDNHKYITFTDREREEHGEKKCKIRNNKIENYYNVDLSKEGLEHEFENNKRATEQRNKGIEESAGTIAVTESAITEAEHAADRAEQETRTEPPIEQRINAKRVERMEETSRIGQEYNNSELRERRTFEAEAERIGNQQRNIGKKQSGIKSRIDRERGENEESYSGKSSIAKSDRIIERSARAVNEGIRTIEQLQSNFAEPDSEQGIDQELQTEIRIIEGTISAISELAEEIGKTAGELADCRREQSDIASKSEGIGKAVRGFTESKGDNSINDRIRSRIEEIRSRIGKLGESHRRIKDSITDCFGKQFDLGRGIEKALDQVQRVFTGRGGR